jgi:hypothetical protein
MFHNTLAFYGGELLAPTPRLEDHPLSAVRDCLFTTFTALQAFVSIRNLRTRQAVVTRDPLNVHKQKSHKMANNMLLQCGKFEMAVRN